MPLGTDHRTNATQASFIPKLWSNEIIAEFERSLVVQPNVKKIPFTGKKGDTLNIPKPSRNEATQKVAETEVTLLTSTESNLQVVVDQHWDYAMLIEDLTDLQQLATAKPFYVSDAAYSLAKRVDTTLVAEAANFTAQLEATAAGVQASAGGAVVFNDAAFRAAINTLDEKDVPMTDRVMIIPPSVKATMSGIERYSSTDFVRNQVVDNGRVTNLYGIDIFCSTNLPTENTDEKGIMLMHKDAIVLAEQKSVRMQTQYKLEHLGNLMVADIVFGTKTYRPEAGVKLYVQDVIA